MSNLNLILPAPRCPASAGAFAAGTATPQSTQREAEPAGADPAGRGLRPADHRRDRTSREAARAHRQGRSQGRVRRRRHQAGAQEAASHAGSREPRHLPPEARRTGRRKPGLRRISERRPAQTGSSCAHAFGLELERPCVQCVLARRRSARGERHGLLAAAAPRAMCAASRRAASLVAAWRRRPRHAATSTNSPRLRFGRPRATPDSSPAGSVSIVSNCLVSSRRERHRARAAARRRAPRQRLDAVRRLEQHLRRRLACAAPERGVALAAARRQEADEREAARRRIAGDAQRRERAARARDRHRRGSPRPAPPRPARAPGSLIAGVPASLT